MQVHVRFPRVTLVLVSEEPLEKDLSETCNYALSTLNCSGTSAIWMTL